MPPSTILIASRHCGHCMAFVRELQRHPRLANVVSTRWMEDEPAVLQFVHAARISGTPAMVLQRPGRAPWIRQAQQLNGVLDELEREMDTGVPPG